MSIASALDEFILRKDIETLTRLYLINSDAKLYLDENLKAILSAFSEPYVSGLNKFGMYAEKLLKDKLLKDVFEKSGHDYVRGTKYAITNDDVDFLNKIYKSDVWKSDFNFFYDLIKLAISTDSKDENPLKNVLPFYRMSQYHYYNPTNKWEKRESEYLLLNASADMFEFLLEKNILPFDEKLLRDNIEDVDNPNFLLYVRHFDKMITPEIKSEIFIRAFAASKNAFNMIYSKYVNLMMLTHKDISSKIFNYLINLNKQIPDISERLLLLVENFQPAKIINSDYQKCLRSRDESLKAVCKFVYGTMSPRELFKQSIKLKNKDLFDISTMLYDPTPSEINQAIKIFS